MDEGSWLYWTAVVLLIFAASYFAAVESAFTTVSQSAGRIKLKTELDKGDRRAKRALHILDNFDDAITTILIGTNTVNIAAAAIVTVLVANRWGIHAVAISTVVMTFVLFFVGEMLPKSLGKKYGCRFSLALSSSLYFLMRALSPLAKLLSKIGKLAACLTKGDLALSFTEDELYDIIENMKDEGKLDAEKGELIYSALTFADITAESVLTPRVDVVAIDINTPLDGIIAVIKNSKHSRFPVYSGSIDEIVGILQIRKFIKAYTKQGSALEIRSVLDECHFAHQSANIDELISAMNLKRLNMAIVTDNYGGTLGLVTMEDILEKLVGEIWDEDDEIKDSCVYISRGVFELDPELSVEESFQLMGFDDPDDFDFEHKLLSEWVYEHFDQIPSVGDSFLYNGIEITVREMRQNRIVKLLATVPPATEDEGGGK